MEPGPSKLIGKTMVLPRERLGGVFGALYGAGYRIVGPTVREGVIQYDDLRRPEELPIGWTEEQSAGRYRLRRRDDDACFGFTPGPHSFKRFLLTPREVLFQARRGERGFSVTPVSPPPERLALIGPRACELAAIAVQDRVLTKGSYADAAYQARRRGLFVVAVQCTGAGGTCFCASMGTGPRANGGFDLALTELLDGGHRFLVEVGSEEGEDLLEPLGLVEATAAERAAAEALSARTAGEMGRQVEREGLRDLLLSHLESPRWSAIAQRCLACGSCTLVCPTCFCTTVEDHGDLAGMEATRVRVWDSCFNRQLSYVHGGSVRASTGSRYRQWLTHKLASWIDQFGESGCVGCGRCITWCPVGIDITEEVAAFREGTPPASTP